VAVASGYHAVSVAILATICADTRPPAGLLLCLDLHGEIAGASMSDIYERGRTIRGEVIGKARSELAVANATEFDEPFQDIALRYCWGEIWGRPGIDRKTRSIINLAMLAAMGRAGELAVHIEGALTNGVNSEEIREIFLQVCVYAGVPAAGEAFAVAKTVIANHQRA
jgi:4-carboxymuconolactone decarboxylase